MLVEAMMLLTVMGFLTDKTPDGLFQLWVGNVFDRPERIR